MTESKRIILNTLASYGKSIITLPLNLLSARWVLQGLGADDYGLYGVVGGVVFFITFANAVSSQAVSRFYAYAIGVEKKNLQVNRGDCEELRCWFNTALSVHILLPVILFSVGYPIGVYSIYHWLVIPPERLSMALWVFRLSLLTTFFSMVYVPYIALYLAHQLIINLTVFTILTSVCTAIFAYSFASVGGDHLLIYAIGTMLISAVIGGVQVLYARYRFSFARITPSMMYDVKRIAELLSFAWWRLLASIGWMLRTQGSAFLANMNFGVSANAALSVSNQLSAQTAAFSAHLGNALMPAIVTATGADERQHSQDLVLRSCKFGTLLVLLFAIPMVAECDFVLQVWLGDPPHGTAPLCICMIIAFVIDRFTSGHEYALAATGRVAAWQTWETIAQASALLVGWVLVSFGCSVVAIGYSYVSTAVLGGIGRVYFARRFAIVGCRALLRFVLFPVLVCGLASCLVPVLITYYFPCSLLRFCATTILSMAALIVASWCLVLNRTEQSYIASIYWGVINRAFARCR